MPHHWHRRLTIGRYTRDSQSRAGRGRTAPGGATLNASVESGVAERNTVEAARRGDARAFNALVEQYQRLAYNVAYRTLGQPDEAADATQDAFLLAFRSMPDFRGGSFKAWLLRIVVNSCYDRLRRQQRQSADSLEALEETHAEAIPQDRRPGPELAALQTETAEVIQQALARLPDEQRFVVVLCDVQGLTYEEAASALDVAVGTIKSRLSRARLRLRDDLAARGELPGATQRPHHERGRGMAAT